MIYILTYTGYAPAVCNKHSVTANLISTFSLFSEEETQYSDKCWNYLQMLELETNEPADEIWASSRESLSSGFPIK